MTPGGESAGSWRPTGSRPGSGQSPENDDLTMHAAWVDGPDGEREYVIDHVGPSDLTLCRKCQANPELVALRDEVERLRDALLLISEASDIRDAVPEVRQIAREALGRPTGSEADRG